MTGPSLSPRPGDGIEVEGRRYRFAPHPAAPRAVHALEASRATVYQVVAEDGAHYALKVFKLRFRTPSLVEITGRLRPLQSLPGLLAAERLIVTTPPPQLPDLLYAVFIPWVHGRTWSDVLVRARRGSTLGLDEAVRLCDRFLLIVETLQSRGIAHTDLSPANVVFDLATVDVQLVDLEDLHIAGATQPGAPSRGSRGYQHPGGETCWHADGDRYSSAILAAEILLSADAQAMRFATDDYCFGPNSASEGDLARTSFLRHRLRLTSGTFASLFDRAWQSSALAECPSAAELRQAIASLRMQLDAGIRWMPREEEPAKPSKEAPARHPVSQPSPQLVPAARPAPTTPPPRLPAKPQYEVQIAARIAAGLAALVLLLIVLFAVANAYGETRLPATAARATHASNRPAFQKSRAFPPFGTYVESVADPQIECAATQPPR
ncbi:MAG TPA: serine/threonine-protein kinase [Thermoanaerobaculia bacterium]|nr:serine/threonine-protein kinase [Thermoanaerobaculia bacterium]